LPVRKEFPVQGIEETAIVQAKPFDDVNAFHKCDALRTGIGPWDQIFCGEFDGRWRKRVPVKIVGE